MSRRTAAGSSGATSNEADTSKNGQDKQKRLLETQDVGHFSMLRALHLADYITAMNGFCGFMSILASMSYLQQPATALSGAWLALAFLPAGLLFDFLDGRVARWRQKSSMMGQELDSLADLISFGVAPAAAAFALGLRSGLDRLALAFFVLCGLTRLARFNVTTGKGSIPHDAAGKARYFEGLPIPSSLALDAWMALWLARGWVGAVPGVAGAQLAAGDGAPAWYARLDWTAGWLKGVPFGVLGRGEWWEWHPATAVFVLWGCAMVSRKIHIPKP